MSPPWVAERTVSAEEAVALIGEQFPILAPVQVELLGAGWDNTAYRVNGTHVFRFPRRLFAVPLLAAETLLLPAIAARLPLSVPTPAFKGRPSDRYPWPFAGYPLLPGRTACVADLDEAERIRTAGPLGRFLAALHAIPAAEASSLGAGPDTLGRLDLARRIPRARQQLDQLVERRIIDDPRPLAALLDAAPDYVPRTDTLVHGDLYVRHLLVDDSKQLAGVIDWGDIHLGDTAADLMAAHVFLPPSAHAAFHSAYGPISEMTWRMAQLRAVWHTLLVLDYAHGIGDADLLREARFALRHLATS